MQPDHTPERERPAGLAALGWDGTFDATFAPHAATGASPARIIAEHRGRYEVSLGEGDRDAVLGGRFRHEVAGREELPAVGDWVAVSIEPGDGPLVVRAVLPRRSAFVRKLAGDAIDAQVVAANVDLALVATALPHDLNVRRLERYIALAWEGGATPIVLLTKSELCDDLPGSIATAAAAAPGAEVLVLSAVTGEGIDALSERLRPGTTAVLIGSSGVGKSTLANRLLGEPVLGTAPVGADGRGHHTTTHRQLVRLASGALLIDTPGMRELQLWAGGDAVDAAFLEIEECASRCRFGDCAHETEPGCAVRSALESGALDAERLESWRRLRREVAWLDRRLDERAMSEHRAGIRSLMRAVRAVRARQREKYD